MGKTLQTRRLFRHRQNHFSKIRQKGQTEITQRENFNDNVRFNSRRFALTFIDLSDRAVKLASIAYLLCSYQKRV